MASDIIREIEKSYMKEDLPQLFPGDSVKVQVRIKEGNKERIQAYEGIVIKLSGNGISKTVTVRRVFQGVGIERVFMLHSPAVEKITVLRRGDVRRAKLYYLRNLAGKAARIREKTNGYAGKLNMAAQAEAASNKKKANKKAAEKAD